MSIIKKIEAFKQREKELKELEDLMVKKDREHQEKSRKDFGIASGDVMGIEELVGLIGRVIKEIKTPEDSLRVQNGQKNLADEMHKR